MYLSGPFLADYGEDGVGVGIWHVEELLPAGAQPLAGHPPRPSAISVWMVCQPVSCGSAQGFRNASTRSWR